MYLPQYKVSVFWNVLIPSLLYSSRAWWSGGNRWIWRPDCRLWRLWHAQWRFEPTDFWGIVIFIFFFVSYICEEEDKDLLYTKKKTTTHQFTSDKILYLSTYILKQTWMQTAWIDRFSLLGWLYKNAKYVIMHLRDKIFLKTKFVSNNTIQ